MKTVCSIVLFVVSVCQATAQTFKAQYVSLAISNNAPAKPFEKFGGFFTQNFHPGIEAAYRFEWSAGKKHAWFQDIQASYFYHRFVQHGISLYTDAGYRYKFNRHLAADGSLGIGGVLSIPATANLSLNNKGEYEYSQSAARLQAIVPLSISVSYIIDPSAKRPVELFWKYQQRVQFGFIKEYVPVLPYSSLSLGVALQL